MLAELGREDAGQVIERARSDGSSAPWTGTVPVGAAMWRPTPPRYVETPFDPTAGSWRPWVIPAGDAYRPPPPPALESAAFRADLDELRRLAIHLPQLYPLMAAAAHTGSTACQEAAERRDDVA